MLSSCQTRNKYISNKNLTDYPSGSGISFYDGKIYLIGDDAASFIIMDTAFNIVDSVQLFESQQKRIPKELKQDLESSTIVTNNDSTEILLVGSGSLSLYRNNGWLINPVTKAKTQIDLKQFYTRLTTAGIKELNIEGLATIKDGIVLASRGNKTFPTNYLIVTTGQFWKEQESASIKIIKLASNADTTIFNGVSGLEYSTISDQLLLTVSTEDTYNAIEDGAIGKSYLWIINNFSDKKNMDTISPDKAIDLEKLNERFKGQKIESVCIISEINKQMELVLVADDDKGGSALFKIRITY